MRIQQEQMIAFLARLTSLRIVLIYAIFSITWLGLSDDLIAALPLDAHFKDICLGGKNWLYILITCCLLYPLLTACMQQIRNTQILLRKNNETLMATNRELAATEEELRRQLATLLSSQDIVRRQNDYLFSLHDTALTLMNRLNMTDLLKNIVEHAAKLADTQHSFIAVCSLTDGLSMKLVTGLYEHTSPILLHTDKSIYKKVCIQGQPVVINNCREPGVAVPDDVQALMYVPLKSGAEIPAVIGLALTETGRRFVSDDVMALSWFSELSSIALDNVRLYAAVQEELAERKRIQADAQKSETQIRALFNALPDMVFRLNGEGVILKCTIPRMTDSLFPELPKDIIGKSVQEIMPPALSDQTLEAMQNVLVNGSVQLVEYQMQHVQGQQYFEARFSPCDKQEVLGIVRNITKQKNMLQRLTYLGMYDTLTGLYNRSQFEKELRFMSHAHCTPLGVIVCDIDGLKLINDALGHTYGDILLQQSAHVLRKAFPAETASIARIGGDEFAVLLANTAAAEVHAACHRIREYEAEYNSRNPGFPLSISLGAAIGSETDVNIDELFQEADNEMYQEKLQRSTTTHNLLFQGMSVALETKDFGSQNHVGQLKILLEKMAVALRLPKRTLHNLFLLAQFHDIGKIVIAEQILNKPGRFTPEEYTEIKRHADAGYRIARAIPALAPIVDWIVRHHEWWNGQGYPFGLKGEEIPLECRMFAIADAYDAMTADRPYRQALTKEQALDELNRCAGIQFDPRLVEKFIKLSSDL